MKARAGKLMTFFVFLFLFFSVPSLVFAQKKQVTLPTLTSEVSPTPVGIRPTETPVAKVDITQKSEEATGPLEKLLNEQKLGPVWPYNFLKYAIRNAVSAGVPANTIVLLLLLTAVAALIAASRHLFGLRGFGIFMPAALSVAFVAVGPVLGIIIFVVMIFFSTLFRMITRRLKLKLQYLPRMAMVLWFVVIGVLGILFLAPVINQPDLKNVSIFPVLILVLLSEDFSRVHAGKSIKTAINMTFETLVLALLSFLLLTFSPLQKWALLNPELFLLLVLVFNYLVGRYVGLRFLEYWRFRKLINP